MAEYKIHNRMTHWQKTYPAWISFAAIAFLLAVWEIICSTGLISSLFLPAPSAILTALGKLITSGEIRRILLGFALGSIIGLLVGLVTGNSALMDRIGTPIVNALYPIPKIALLPLFILWLGIGELSKVTIIALGVFFPVAMNTYSGVKNVDTLLIKVAVSFNASWWLTMKSVVLPSALPVIFAGLPEIFESEGYDRTSMKLPQCQDRLIEEVLKVQPNVVVVLHNGSPVELPWADRRSMSVAELIRPNLQSSQIDLVIVGTFSVCSVISCSFFCIYIDVELFALKAFCFCIFLNSCLKVGNCDGCLKNFKCDAADLMVLYSVLNFFYYFWCLGCYSLGCFLDCFYSFFSCRCFLNLLYS